MRRSALALACACLCGAAPAHAAVTLSGSWLQEREIETGLPSSGYSAGVSLDVDALVFLGASYSELRTDAFADALDGVVGRLVYETAGADIGVVWPWSDTLGMTATGGYAWSKTKGLDGFRNDRPEDSGGATGSVGFWYQPGSLVAYNLGGGYSYIGGVRGWNGSAGLGVRLWRELWLDGGYWRGDDIQGWSAGLRMSLGGP